jgi:hypothetical protein
MLGVINKAKHLMIGKPLIRELWPTDCDDEKAVERLPVRVLREVPLELAS